MLIILVHNVIKTVYHVKYSKKIVLHVIMGHFYITIIEPVLFSVHQNIGKTILQMNAANVVKLAKHVLINTTAHAQVATKTLILTPVDIVF